MKLVLNDEQKDVYLALNQLEENDIYAFCKESIRVLKSGSSNEIAESLTSALRRPFRSSASSSEGEHRWKTRQNEDEMAKAHRKLNTRPEFDHQNLSKGIFLLMNETDLQKLIAKQLNVESTEKVRKTMCDFYRLHHDEIQSIITEQTYLNTNIVPRFQDFSWRLQVQLASRATSGVPGRISTSDGATGEPPESSTIDSDSVSVLLRFKLRKLNTNEFDCVLIRCDLNQLAIFQQTLDQAIKEIKLKKSWINADFD